MFKLQIQWMSEGNWEPTVYPPSPYDVTIKSHRNIPNFYRPLNIKPMTKIGFNYIKKFS